MNKSRIKIYISKSKQHTFKPYSWSMVDFLDEIELVILKVRILYF